MREGEHPLIYLLDMQRNAIESGDKTDAMAALRMAMTFFEAQSEAIVRLFTTPVDALTEVQRQNRRAVGIVIAHAWANYFLTKDTMSEEERHAMLPVMETLWTIGTLNPDVDKDIRAYAKETFGVAVPNRRPSAEPLPLAPAARPQRAGVGRLALNGVRQMALMAYSAAVIGVLKKTVGAVTHAAHGALNKRKHATAEVPDQVIQQRKAYLTEKLGLPKTASMKDIAQGVDKHMARNKRTGQQIEEMTALYADYEFVKRAFDAKATRDVKRGGGGGGKSDGVTTNDDAKRLRSFETFIRKHSLRLLKS